MNKLVLIIVAVAVVVGGGSFYAGMKYDQSKTTADRQARMQQFGTGGNGGQRGARGGGGLAGAGGFTAGEIISKDAASVTIKLRDGGSKIIFLTDQTPVLKSAAGTSGDLVVGSNVTVNGTPNQDGSISAESIQIRPKMPQN